MYHTLKDTAPNQVGSYKNEILDTHTKINEKERLFFS